MEPGVQTPDHTLRTGIGSCRDSAWLLVSILRQLGLAARFVSGYLVQLTSDVEALDGPSGPAADFTDLHAWTEVYIPGAGWIGMDPTSGLFAGEGHIPLSATPHPASAAPITGATEPCETTLDFSNVVSRVHEDPRVTLPYTDGVLGRDQRARRARRRAAGGRRCPADHGRRAHVRLDRQPGRPGVDHRRRRPAQARARLRAGRAAEEDLGPAGSGAAQSGQVVPGRAVAALADRPALAHRRRTAVDRRRAAGRSVARRARHARVAPDAGQSLLGAIADGLGLPDTQVRPAYEDALSRLAGAVRQPARRSGRRRGRPGIGQPPTPRAALLARLDASVTEPAAYVLPLHRRDDEPAGPAPTGRLRRGRIVLLDGDSPAGLRLPLDSISWQPPPASIRRRSDPAPASAASRRGGRSAEDAAVVRRGRRALPTTALVAEVRDGLLYVFLPPTEELDALRRPDPPDRDARGQDRLPAGDRGLRPAGRRPAAVDVRHPRPRRHRGQRGADGQLRRAARAAGDAVRAGAAGPSVHRVVRRRRHPRRHRRRQPHHPRRHHPRRFPAAAPSRPAGLAADLLAAPSVAVLPVLRPVHRHDVAGAAGRRGPAGFALRAGDRVRRDRPAAPAAEGGPKPWITDRALRHLLTDITGNTHRAEFCIDKLYSPDSARGRLGLLELRGFEMPPHYQMAMVQSLLVRSLVAWFWDEPLRAPLIRHGANLHGRYLLPHFIIHDIAEVAADLRAHGIEFDTSWLDPFTEFRFPRIGTAVFGGVEIELRGAIEPWNVLGEESTAGGTARYVDSSVERIQVRLIGADRQPLHRHRQRSSDPDAGDRQPRRAGRRGALPRLAAAQRAAPDDHRRRSAALRTGRRRRAGCPAAAAPITCRTRVAAPTTARPVNAVEAESRRGRRFEASGFTAGKVDLAGLREKQARQSTDVGAPGILDLRRVRTVLQ